MPTPKQASKQASKPKKKKRAPKEKPSAHEPSSATRLLLIAIRKRTSRRTGNQTQPSPLPLSTLHMQLSLGARTRHCCSWILAKARLRILSIFVHLLKPSTDVLLLSCSARRLPLAVPCRPLLKRKLHSSADISSRHLQLLWAAPPPPPTKRKTKQKTRAVNRSRKASPAPTFSPPPHASDNVPCPFNPRPFFSLSLSLCKGPPIFVLATKPPLTLSTSLAGYTLAGYTLV